MHQPFGALPGGAMLYSDPAAQAIAARAFGPRQSIFPAVTEFEQGFVAPAFLNLWVNYGSTFTNVGYYKDRTGVVHLRGLMKDGTVGLAAFTLPAGYRPSATELFAVVSNNAFGRVDVLSDGTVQLATGSNVFASLSGISFRAV